MSGGVFVRIGIKVRGLCPEGLRSEEFCHKGLSLEVFCPGGIMSRLGFVRGGHVRLPWKTLHVNDRPSSVQLLIIKVTCCAGILGCWYYYYCYDYFYYIALSLTFVNLLVVLIEYGDNVQYK